MKKDEQDYFEEEEFQENLERYEQAKEEGIPIYMDPEDLTDIAEYYMTQFEEEKADECISLAIDLHPDAIDPQIFLARQQLFHDKIEEAYKIFQQIPEQDNREVIFLHAEILLKDDKVDEADRLMEEVYEKLVEEEDEDNDYFLYDMADLLYEYNYYEVAHKWTARLQKEFPDFHEAKMLMGDIMMKLCNFPSAEQQATAMLDQNAFHQNAWMLLSEALMMQEKCDEAIEATDYLLAINEHHPEAMLTRASALFYLNRYGEAHEQYAKYIEQYPDESTVHYLNGLCLVYTDRFEEAKNEFLKAIELSTDDTPELLHTHVQLAFVYSKMRKLDEAIEQADMAAACKAAPDSPMDFLVIKGHIYLENERYVKAEEYFQKAVETSDSPYDTIFLVGIAAGETGYYQKAIQIFEMLYESDMEDAHQRTAPYLAYCHFLMEHNEKFLSYLKEGAEINPAVTQQVFARYFPNVPVADYYKTAKRDMEQNRL